MPKYRVRITEIGTRSVEIDVEADSPIKAETEAWYKNPGFDDPLEPDETHYRVVAVDGVEVEVSEKDY